MGIEEFRHYLHRCNLSVRTIEHYCHLYPHLINACPLRTPEEFERLLGTVSQRASAALMNKYVMVMKKIVEHEGLDFPEKLLKKFKESPKTRLTFTDEEIEQFLAVETSPDFSMFWMICVYLGMRPGEVASLEIQHLDLSAGSLSIPRSKTGTGRTIKLPEVLKERLAVYSRDKSKKLFFSKEGYDIYAKAWLRDFRERIERIGIKKPVTPYCFRHTLATKLLHNDASLFAVQDILGHTDPNTTRIYYHGNLKAQEKAFSKDSLTRKHLGGKHLIKQIEEYMDGLDLYSSEDIDIVKIMEAKKLMWEAVRH